MAVFKKGKKKKIVHEIWGIPNRGYTESLGEIYGYWHIKTGKSEWTKE